MRIRLMIFGILGASASTFSSAYAAGSVVGGGGFFLEGAIFLVVLFCVPFAPVIILAFRSTKAFPPKLPKKVVILVTFLCSLILPAFIIYGNVTFKSGEFPPIYMWPIALFSSWVAWALFELFFSVPSKDHADRKKSQSHFPL